MKILFLLFILYFDIYANVQFTEEEKDWIKSNSTAKISMMNNFQPFSYFINNEHKGFSVDLLNEISRISGLKFEIETSSWSNILENFKSGKTDIISGISYTKDRENFTLFTTPYYEVPTFVFGLKNDKDYIDNDSLIGKKIGISQSIFYKNDLEKLGITVIEFDSNNAKANSLITGKIDYFLASYTSGLKAINSLSLINVKPMDEFKSIKKEDLRFGINKDKPILKSILQKSLNSIDNDFLIKLATTWIAQNEDNVYFTDEEIAFINNSSKIKIGSINSYVPFSFIQGNSKIGFTQELIDLISQKSGLDFEKIGGSWPEVFDKFKSGQIDIISELSYREERLNFTSYTKPYYEIPISVFARDDFGIYKSIEDLKGKKIGIVKDSYLVNILKELDGIEVIEYPTNDDKYFALRNKEVDVVLSSSTSIYRIEQLMLSNIKQVGLFIHKNVKNEDLRFGITKSNPILASIINKTFNSIPYSKLTQLKQKWILEDYKQILEDEKNLLSLTKEEVDYISRVPVIKYSEVDWKPLSIIEDNKMKGIMGEYLELVSKRTGLKFEYIPSKSWGEVLEQFKNKKIDLVPGIGTSLEETSLGLVSKTYSQYPMVIVTNDKFNYIQNLNELKENKIAVPRYYTSYNFILENYPELEIYPTTSIEEALILVESGRVDAFVGHIATSLYAMSELHLKNLKISGITDFTFEHKYLIQNHNEILLSIINKAFDSITEIEKKKIYSKWVQPSILKETVDYSLIYKLLNFRT